MSAHTVPGFTDSSSTDSYRYTSVLKGRTIRLLHLESSDEDDVLRCILRECPLDQGASFNALSYAWGSGSVLQSICCDGRLLQITQSLRDALLEFRRRGELAPL
jgi:Heterokaryon incompatibility protein (HET)